MSALERCCAGELKECLVDKGRVISAIKKMNRSSALASMDEANVNQTQLRTASRCATINFNFSRALKRAHRQV